MNAIRFRSPVLKPLLRAGTLKPVLPDPRAYDTFRVTQTFDALDSFYAEIDRRAGREPRKHNATDIGNFRCGDPVVAMADGTLRRVKDQATRLGAITDALGVVIDHGNNVQSQYWHLDAYAGPASGPVKAGQQIGVVGRTGLGNVCHLHVEVHVNGQRIDPEPLMFGGSLGGDDMKYASGNQPFFLADIAPGTNLRSAPTLKPETVALFLDPAKLPAPIQVGVWSYSVGDAWQGSTTWAFIGWDGRGWYVHSKLLSNLRPTSALPVQPAKHGIPAAIADPLLLQINDAQSAVDSVKTAIGKVGGTVAAGRVE